ncbi:MAG: hypothetical protein JSR59_03035 [Proteobacteria bacterium]|nr:hypothetical protein [Pseudomonadota bacterium]
MAGTPCGALAGGLIAGVMGVVTAVSFAALLFAELLADRLGSGLALLLNAAALESATRRQVDLDRELRAAGIANVAAGIVDGLPGYPGSAMPRYGSAFCMAWRATGTSLRRPIESSE